MKNLAILTVAAALGASPALAATTFNVNLDSAQEVPPGGATSSPGTGSGTLALGGGAANPTLSFAINFDGTHDFGRVIGGQFDQMINFDMGETPQGDDVSALHIHNADRGVAGPVVFGLIGPSSDTDDDFRVSQTADGFLVSGEWDTGEGNGGADLTDFVSELLGLSTGEDAPFYFNLHTPNDPSGAIRGQVVATNNVSAVPLPAALPLLLAAIGGLGFASRRRSA